MGIPDRVSDKPKMSSNKVSTPDPKLKYTFVHLTPEYKTPLNVEISCACGITFQRRVNYGNLMNIFVYRNHVVYYSFLASIVHQHKFIKFG